MTPSDPHDPFDDGDGPELSDHSKDQTLLAARIFDYIDSDGEMLMVDVVDEEFLAVSVQRRGQTEVLSALVGEIEQARKMAHAIIEWADDIEEARRED